MTMTKQLHSGMDTQINPCHGCVSTDCRTCACAGESERLQAAEQQVEAKRTIGASADHRQANRSRADDDSRSVRRTAKRRLPDRTQKTPVPDRFLGGVKQRVYLPHRIFGELGNGMLVRVDGDGMTNAGIHDGDWLVFDSEKPCQDGDIALVAVDEQTMCRRVLFEGDMIRVRREDGITPDIVTNQCEIYAVLVGLMRNLQNKNTAESEEGL